MSTHHSDSRPIINLNANLQYIAKHLTHEDWEKIIFLCGKFTTKEDDLTILNKLQDSQDPDFQNLKDIIFQIRVHKGILDSSQDESILLELLYCLKKYRLLKTLFSCKHKLAEKENNYIEPLWNYLFNVVEDLSEEELSYLGLKMDSTVNCSTFVSAKELFLKAIENKDEIIRKLKVIFRSSFSSRPELYEKALNYEKNMKPCYSIDRGRKYGYAVIFNHLNFDKVPPQNCLNRTDLEVRKGTNKDADNLRKLWEEYGMDVEIHRDLTSVQLKGCIQELALRRNYDKYQIFICCILSHGTKDYVYASDGVVVQINWIHTMFGEHTKSLSNKPKLFFIQACQGDESNRFMSDATTETNPIQIQQYSQASEQSTVSRQSSNPPLQADILIGTSTVPGYKSWRSESLGSVYIQTLVEILSERGDKDEFRELMKDINHEVSLKEINGVTCQMPTITHQLRKNLYLKRFPARR